jgi:hypothetical protein
MSPPSTTNNAAPSSVTFTDDTKPPAVESTAVKAQMYTNADNDADFDASNFSAFLVEEQPSMDAALKSYASWIAATQPAVSALPETSAVASATNMDTQNQNSFSSMDDDLYNLIPTTWTLPEILSMTRLLSKQINQHTFAVQHSETPIYSETSKVWNNVVGQKQKPTRVLGRTALRIAWHDLDLEYATTSTTSTSNDKTVPLTLAQQKTALFVQRFGELLLAGQPGQTQKGQKQQHVADARLIWASDKGQEELQRRAAQRNQRAAVNVQEAASLQQSQAALHRAVVEVSGAGAHSTLTIEELPDDAEQES